MVCRYVRTIYRNKENGYCIFLYETEEDSVPEQIKTTQKGKKIRFTAIGNNMPDTDSVELDMQGNWVKSKYGLQFKVDTYEEVLPQTLEGITGYLSSGLIKGIGPKIAEQIVDKFGLRTFEIFDQYPDNLLQIKGITEKKLKCIMDSYHGSHAIRDLATFLTPFDVTPNKIQKIYDHFGCGAVDMIKQQPFSLCQIKGFVFLTVDKIAKANKGKPNNSMRIEGGIHYCMELAIQEGHLFLNKEEIQKKAWELLNEGYEQEVVSEAELSGELYRLVKDKELYFENGALYPAKLYQYECEAAKNLAELLVQETEELSQIDALIAEAQRELGIQLASKQVEAVRKAFCHWISIITGGPGTGKTTVQKVILYVNRKLGGYSVLLTAPTGRASRRMSESTGYPGAMTMHSAMGLTGEDVAVNISEPFEKKLILADEFTMSDMRLSWEFFRRIKKGTRLVLIGDVNQLPSVGPGNVFRELVMCGVVPMTTLDFVFRQAEDSMIILNAHRMLANNAKLDYGEEFEFIPAENAADAAEKIIDLYCKEVKKHGLENVQVLTPHRKKGAVSVNELNTVLWEIINPKAIGGQAGKLYLDVAFRKLWFRLKYPEGKSEKKILKVTDQMVIVEARVYLDRNDPENSFIANAFACKFFTDDPQFGNKFVELAETAAEGRALANAGFGLQFADKEGDLDPEVADAPFDTKFIAGNSGMSFFDEAGEEMMQQTDADEQSDMIPGQFGIESYIPMPGETGGSVTNLMNSRQTAESARTTVPQQNAMNRPSGAHNQVQHPAMPNMTPSIQQPAGHAPQQFTKQPEIRKDMPLEQIYSLLTPETAAAVVINIGFNKGKTLGQVAVEKPASLDWYVNAYEGPDNLLRAAAKYLMDAALQKAS